MIIRTDCAFRRLLALLDDLSQIDSQLALSISWRGDLLVVVVVFSLLSLKLDLSDL